MTDAERRELEQLKKEAAEFQKQAMEWQQRAYKAERERDEALRVVREYKILINRHD